MADIINIDITLTAISAQHHMTVVPDVEVIMADVMVVARLDALAVVVMVVVDTIIAK